MKRFIMIFVVLALILTDVIISCAKKEPEVIKIGAILTLTGDVTVRGNNIIEGIDLAMDKINSL